METLTDIENKLALPKAKARDRDTLGVWDEQIQAPKCKKDKEQGTQRSATACTAEQSAQRTCAHVYLIHSAPHLELTEHCK